MNTESKQKDLAELRKQHQAELESVLNFFGDDVPKRPETVLDQPIDYDSVTPMTISKPKVALKQKFATKRPQTAAGIRDNSLFVVKDQAPVKSGKPIHQSNRLKSIHNYQTNLDKRLS